MVQQQKEDSTEKALELYEIWVNERQNRPDVKCSEDKAGVNELRKENFSNQVVKPRKNHIEQLKKSSRDISFADMVSLLVMLELPAIEISTLLQRLNSEMLDNPTARYFSEVNQVARCGCGCG